MIPHGRVLLAVLALFSSAQGLDLNSLKPQGYVSDFAGVVDPASRQKIELYGARLEKATGAQIAIVTLQSLEGEPIEDVANDLFRRWGIGKKGEDNGLLFLLVIQDRRSRLETGFGLEPIINAGQAGSLLRSDAAGAASESVWRSAMGCGDRDRRQDRRCEGRSGRYGRSAASSCARSRSLTTSLGP